MDYRRRMRKIFVGPRLRLTKFSDSWAMMTKSLVGTYEVFRSVVNNHYVHPRESHISQNTDDQADHTPFDSPHLNGLEL